MATIEDELASRDDLEVALGVLRAADRAASEAAHRVVAWMIREVEAFERESGSPPGATFGPGLVRGVLQLTCAAQGTLAARAIEAVAARARDRMREQGTERTVASAFAGADALIDRVLTGFTTAAMRARRPLAARDMRLVIEWAEAEARHAAEIEPQPGALTFALGALWVVEVSSGPWQPRRDVSPERWSEVCRRTFGLPHLPPRLMARLRLEATWIQMGLPAPLVIWPADGVGRGAAVFTHAADPLALAESLEGHARSGPPYRYLAGGGEFRLAVHFEIRAVDGVGLRSTVTELGSIDYELDLPRDAQPAPRPASAAAAN